MAFGEPDEVTDATDPHNLLSKTLMWTNGGIDAARLNAGGPPPSTACLMAPAGGPNGGKQVSIQSSHVGQKLAEALPDAVALPTCRADANSVFAGYLLPDTPENNLTPRPEK